MEWEWGGTKILPPTYTTLNMYIYILKDRIGGGVWGGGESRKGGEKGDRGDPILGSPHLFLSSGGSLFLLKKKKMKKGGSARRGGLLSIYFFGVQPALLRSPINWYSTGHSCLHASKKGAAWIKVGWHS